MTPNELAEQNSLTQSCPKMTTHAQDCLALCHQIERCGASEELTKASVMASALLKRLSEAAPQGQATVEDAAKFLEKKSNDHWSENGRHDPDTNTPEPEEVADYCDMLNELAEEIRSLKPTSK